MPRKKSFGPSGSHAQTPEEVIVSRVDPREFARGIKDPYSRYLILAIPGFDINDPHIRNLLGYLSAHASREEGNAFVAVQLLIAAGTLGLKAPSWAVQLVGAIFRERLASSSPSLDDRFGFTKPGKGGYKQAPIYQSKLVGRNDSIAFSVRCLYSAGQTEKPKISVEEAVERVARALGVRSNDPPAMVRKIYYAWRRQHPGFQNNPVYDAWILINKPEILKEFPPTT